MFLTEKYCWPKGASLECVESIYVKITEAACVSEELYVAIMPIEEEVGQIMSLGDSRIYKAYR